MPDLSAQGSAARLQQKSRHSSMLVWLWAGRGYPLAWVEPTSYGFLLLLDSLQLSSPLSLSFLS